ncbi:MAG TPA: hypothetical protein PKC28_11910, partial [Bdellovibrionales bacterium]|nr:hypothetical protein [Bdellovibrionales bacterium]
MRSLGILLALSVSAAAWAGLLEQADASRYRLSTTPYEIVAPILNDDPATGDRVAGQMYYN